MANRHIKVINGRKYYYESIRIGKKVTSKYLGPVERIRKKKSSVAQNEMMMQAENGLQEGSEPVKEEENYIG